MAGYVHSDLDFCNQAFAELAQGVCIAEFVSADADDGEFITKVTELNGQRPIGLQGALGANRMYAFAENGVHLFCAER